MGDRVLLFGFLSVAIAIISLSFGNTHYRQPCTTDSHCDKSMRCLLDGNIKLCECSIVSRYFKDKNKCLVIPTGFCIEGETECIPGAYCDLGESTCKCLPGHIETYDSSKKVTCETNTIFAVETTTRVSALPGKTCNGDDNCGFQHSFLKCLPKDGSNVHVCSCGRTRTFDKDSGQCRIYVGGACDIASSENPHPSQCVKQARCKANLDDKGQLTKYGTCCYLDGSGCEEYLESAEKNKDYRLGPCVSDEHCLHHLTFLKCLQTHANEHLCDCGANNQYDPKLRKCFLGVGNDCTTPTYSRRHPQQCIENAVCIPHKDTKGKELREGTCTCKHGSREKTCNNYTKTPTSLPMSSAGYGSYQADRSVYVLIIISFGFFGQQIC